VTVTKLQHLSSRGLGKSSKIPSYTNLWLRLSKLTQDLGNCAGFTYGGQTLLYFAITILLTYGFMVELAEGFSYILFTAALLFLVIILSGCISAHGVSNEVCIGFFVPMFFALYELTSYGVFIDLSHKIYHKI
jgi:hypothetical protein